MKFLSRAALALALLCAPLAALAGPNDAFAPTVDSTVAVAASTSNTNGTLINAPSTGAFQVRVLNACSTTAFIRFGGSATTSNLPILTGSAEVFTVQPYTATVGVILASGSGCNVYFTTGAGL